MARRQGARTMGQRVLVCGGRDYKDVDAMYRILDAAHASNPIECLISGMARGADSIALMWADEHGIPVAPYPADWQGHGKGAGYIRNQQMLDEGKPRLVLAFPGGRGTDDMVRRSHKAGVPVVRIREREPA